MSDTWIDTSKPEYPREVHADHIAADADHAVVPVFDGSIAFECGACGLAVTSDGLRHGFDV